MLKLSTPTTKDLDDYSDSIKEKLVFALKQNGLNGPVKRFLTPSKIKEILTDSPDKLLKHHSDLMMLFIAGYDEIEYESYFDIKKKKKAFRNAGETKIFQKYSKIKKIFSVFNYEKFISSSKKTSYDLALKLNRNTCTYCNRLYTTTVISKDEKTKRINNNGRITRPQFDHWFAKSLYPFLALSYFNLIPSCSVCNSSIKGDAIFTLPTHAHPYIIEIGEGFAFSYNFKNVYENNVKIVVTDNSKTDTTLKEFKIHEIYNAHSSLELKDLLELKFKYSEDYLDTLLNKTFKSLSVSKPEIYRLIFGIEINEVDFHKRPFSKFKSDILKELEIIIR